MEELRRQEVNLKQLENNLDTVLSIDPESLVQRDTLGEELDFDEALPVFRRLHGLFQDLRRCNLQELPANTLNNTDQIAAKALGLFKQIQEFSAGGHNAIEERNKLMRAAGDLWYESYHTIGPVIAYSYGTPPRLREAYDKLLHLNYAQIRRSQRRWSCGGRGSRVQSVI